jgi:hypothetical protein
MRMSTPVGLAVTVVLALALAGCGPMAVGSYAESGVDFTQYLSYGWAPTEERPTGDPRLDNNPFFADRLNREIERQLSRRGYVRVSLSSPDLLVRTYVNFREIVDTDSTDRPRPPTGREGPEPFVVEAGTLWIDVLDAHTGTMIWRGWAEGSVDGVIDDQAWMNRKIDEAVARIMEKFPRRR